jgi:hypothetical protein
MDQPLARIQYEATAQDYADALRHAMRRGPWAERARRQLARIRPLAWLLAIAMGVAAGAVLASRSDPFLAGFLVCASVITLAIAIWITPTQLLIDRAIDRSVAAARPYTDASAGAVEFELMDGGVRVARDEIESTIGWTHLRDVLITERMIILVLKIGGTIPIPRRGIGSPTFDALAAQIEHDRGRPNVQMRDEA